MLAQRRQEVAGIASDDEAQLAMRPRFGWDGVGWLVDVARTEGEGLQAVPTKDALGRRQTGFAPVRVDRGVLRAAADLDIR